MLLDAPKRYCKNLTAFIISKPPCVIFTIFLCCLAITLLWLGFYVNNNEVVDPEAQKDWNAFLASLSNVHFCIDKGGTKTDIQELKLVNETAPKIPTMPNSLTQISIPLTIGVHLRNKDHYLHSNITHLTSLMEAPVDGSGFFRKTMNLTFSLSELWNTGKACIEGNKCRLSEGFFHSCVTVEAPREILPKWKSETCNASLFTSKTATMKALTRKSQHSKCQSGALIYFKHPLDLELQEKLSLNERAKANLHLQVTSYFLFILVITSIIYGMLKGKPLKTKKRILMRLQRLDAQYMDQELPDLCTNITPRMQLRIVAFDNGLPH